MRLNKITCILISLSIIINPFSYISTGFAAQNSTVPIAHKKGNLKFLEENRTPTFEEVLALIESIENSDEDELDEIYTEEEHEKIAHLFAKIASCGTLPDGTDAEEILKEDTQDLLINEETDLFSFAYSSEDYVVTPLLLNNQWEFIPCKHRGFVKKSWKKTTKFTKKHKKELLIGAAVVVAVVVVAAVVIVAPAAGAIAAGSVAAGTANTSKEDEAIVQKQQQKLNEILAENISSIKETVAEEDVLGIANETIQQSHSLVESARDLGAGLAHEVFEDIVEFSSIVPQFCEEVRDVCSRINPNKEGDFDTEEDLRPIETFQNFVAKGHEAIDKVFSTNIAQNYSPEAKEAEAVIKKELHIDETIAFLPPPGTSGFSKATPRYGCVPATQAKATCGWKVGESTLNRTKSGKVPKWSTVRQRHWKSKAHFYSDKYEAHELKRMKKGLAPQRINKKTGKLESMELHHNPPMREGGLFEHIEVWPSEHAKLDPYRHIGG